MIKAHENGITERAHFDGETKAFEIGQPCNCKCNHPRSPLDHLINSGLSAPKAAFIVARKAARTNDDFMSCFRRPGKITLC